MARSRNHPVGPRALYSLRLVATVADRDAGNRQDRRARLDYDRHIIFPDHGDEFCRRHRPFVYASSKVKLWSAIGSITDRPLLARVMPGKSVTNGVGSGRNLEVDLAKHSCDAFIAPGGRGEKPERS